MSIGFHFDDDDNSAYKDQWIEKKKAELIEDSCLAFMHWRDFDAEAEEAWKEEGEKEV